MTRRVNVPCLPGEPLDGTGRVCIHLYVQDAQGPFVEPHVLHPELDAAGQPIKQRVVARPTRGRLACDPKRGVAPVRRGDVVHVTPRTDDPRAVTCPKCKSTAVYADMVARIEATQQKRGVPSQQP